MGLMNWFRRTEKPESHVDGNKPPVTELGPESITKVLSLLGPDVGFEYDLKSAAVAGVFRSIDMAPEKFVQNFAFVETVHRVVREQCPRLQQFQEAARRQGKGWLYVSDARTPEGPNGRVPPEDIVGGFEVTDGRVLDAAYMPNPNYRVFTQNGLTRLPEPLQSMLKAELKRLIAAGG
jgi:hypothetical protein